MQRETNTVKLPVSGLEVVLNNYLIGRERRALANVYLDNGISIGSDGTIGAVTSKITDAAQDLAWKIVIVSIAGKSESIVDDVLALTDVDYSFLVDQVNQITKNKITEEKKKN